MSAYKNSVFDSAECNDGLTVVFLAAFQKVKAEQLRREVPVRIASLQVWFQQVDIRMSGITHLYPVINQDWVKRAHKFVQLVAELQHETDSRQWGNVRGVLARIEAERVAINSTLAENGVL